jgi:hypothetical protein
MKWSYLHSFESSTPSDNYSDVQQIEIVSMDEGSMVLRRTTRDGTSVFRVDCRSGMAESYDYHNGWWIPIPVSASQMWSGVYHLGLDKTIDSCLGVEKKFKTIQGTNIPAIRLVGQWSYVNPKNKDMEHSVAVEKWFSAELGVLIQSQTENRFGATESFVRQAQKRRISYPYSDLYGFARDTYELNAVGISVLFGDLTQEARSELPGKEVIIKEKETILKQIVKVRCRYCKVLFDESLDICPNCGGLK